MYLLVVGTLSISNSAICVSVASAKNVTGKNIIKLFTRVYHAKSPLVCIKEFVEQLRIHVSSSPSI